ncbi:MAG: hypothetical protein V7703_11150 [Hyphomicrobiales bacterium]
MYRHFDGLAATLQRQGQSLVFAMNAGMYHSNRDAVGPYIEVGIEHSHLNDAELQDAVDQYNAL